jgi:transposase-like protein
MYRSNYVVDYIALYDCHSCGYHTTFRMAGSASSIDNTPDTSLAVQTRTFYMIKMVGL